MKQLTTHNTVSHYFNMHEVPIHVDTSTIYLLSEMTIRTAATQSVVRLQVVIILTDLHVAVIQNHHPKRGTTSTNYLQNTNKVCYGCNMPPPKVWYDLHNQPAKQHNVVWLSHAATQSVVRHTQPVCKPSTQCGMVVTCRHPQRGTT